MSKLSNKELHFIGGFVAIISFLSELGLIALSIILQQNNFYKYYDNYLYFFIGSYIAFLIAYIVGLMIYFRYQDE